MSIPHFDIPFRYSSGANPAPMTVEQDSIDDIMNCVEAILRTRVGLRYELPTFGITDPTFSLQPIDTDLLKQEILDQEPRAAVLFQQAPDAYDQMVVNVLANVASAQEATA